MILVGTSGFQFKDWRGPFYPHDLKDSDLLRFYTRLFPALELNFTYYQMPGQRTIEGLERKTPPGFEISVKAHRSMTHEPASPADEVQTIKRFRGALDPLVVAGKLACVLAQFPWSFRNTEANRARVARLRELLPDVPVIAEFRNAEWAREPVFDFLRRNGVGYCCVDEPRLRGLMPPVAVATSGLGYVRFHGRNAARWWLHKEPGERYDYLYSADELQEWIPRILHIARQTEKTLVFFNNCHEGKAPRNALMFQKMLGLSPEDAGGDGQPVPERKCQGRGETMEGSWPGKG